jgi:hypothetical protein
MIERYNGDLRNYDQFINCAHSNLMLYTYLYFHHYMKNEAHKVKFLFLYDHNFSVFLIRKRWHGTGCLEHAMLIQSHKKGQ